MIKLQKKTEHKPNWSQVLDRPYRILMIGGSGLEKQAVYLM